jgi:hypothetical protein
MQDVADDMAWRTPQKGRAGRLAAYIAATLMSVSLLVGGCAKVTVTPLAVNGRPSGEAEGVRYYLPKPYLLVMNLAGASGGGGESPPPGQTVDPKTGQPIGPGAPGGGDNSSGQSGGGGGSAAPSASGDTSYMAADSHTVAKLIYLPDYSHPMAITEFPGLFGSASVNVSLQDGWMLTALQGSGDSKTAETLTALASLASAIGGTVTGGAAKAAVKAPSGAGGQRPAVSPAVLPPGLYSFVYSPAGLLTGVCLVTPFDRQQANPVLPCPAPGEVAPGAAPVR